MPEAIKLSKCSVKNTLRVGIATSASYGIICHYFSLSVVGQLPRMRLAGSNQAWAPGHATIDEVKCG